MSDHRHHANAARKQKGLLRLANDLSEFKANNKPITNADNEDENEMLSLVVSEVLNGVDISERYPTFYRKILNDGDLRQSFLDMLGMMENTVESVAGVLPLSAKPALSFLAQKPPSKKVTKLDVDKWRTTWRQSIDQLRAIFSPPELAYRSDPSLFEDPWITLVRDEIEVDGIHYMVILECSPSEQASDILAVSFNLAVNAIDSSSLPPQQLEATLEWGTYDSTITISQEGRLKFPDIPLAAIFDAEQQNVNAELSLILENSA